MVSLDDLMKVEGVAVAGRYTMDGKCTEHKVHMDMTQEMADKAAQYTATVTMMFNTLAGAFSKESGMNWIPQHGWTYCGGEWTIVAWGDVAVFCQSEKTDMMELFGVLTGECAEARAGI